MKRFSIISLLIVLLPLFLTGQQIKQEIISERDFSVKKYKLDKNIYQVEFSSKPMHYLDENGKYLEIDSKWVKNGDTFENNKNTFISRVNREHIHIISQKSKGDLDISGFLLNGKKIAFNTISKTTEDKLRLQSKTGFHLDIENDNGALNLLWNNLTVSSDFTFVFTIKSDKYDLTLAKVMENSVQITDFYSLTHPVLISSNEIKSVKKYSIVSTAANKLVLSITLDSTTPPGDYLIQSTLVENTVNLGGSAFSMDEDGQPYSLKVYSFGDNEDVVRYQELWGVPTSKIPSNATIISTTHKIKLKQKNNYNVEIVSVADATSDAEIWTNIGNGSEYDTFNPSNITGDYYSKDYTGNDDFISDLQDRIGLNFRIGGRLANEGSYGLVEFYDNRSLAVTYEMDANITVQNEFSGGKVFVDDMVNDKNAPFYTYKSSGSQIELKAKDEQNADGYLQFYKHWLKPDFSTESLIQFTDPISDDNTKTYTAHFDRQFDLTVHYDLLNGGTPPANDVFTGLEEHSTEIEIDPVNDVSVNGRSIDYHFGYWDDGNTENPRVFNPQDHTTYTAKMKGQMASNNSRATGYNGGRRVYKFNSTIHMVYEDNGAIWYTKSLDDGNTWTVDVMFSQNTSGSTYKNPSISGVTDYVLIVYEELDNSGYTKLRFHYYYAGSWHYGDGYGSVLTSSYGGEGLGTGEARPVLSSSYSARIGCAWRFESEDDPGITRIYYSTFIFNNSRHWSAIEQVPGGSNGYPSIDWDNTASHKIALVWPESNHLHYIYKANYSGSWSSEYTLTSYIPSYQYNHQMPSIVVDNNIMSVAWKGEHFFYGPELYYQKFNISSATPSAIGSLTSLHTYYYTGQTVPENPTIGISGDVAVFYEKHALYGTTGTMQKRVYGGSSWSSATSFGDGKYASIPHDRPTGAVWTSYTSAPYILNNDYTGGGMSKVASGDSITAIDKPQAVNKRFDFNFSDDSTKYEFLSLKLTALNVDSRIVELNDANQGAFLHLDGSDDIVMTWKVVAKDISSDLDIKTELMKIYLVEDNERILLETYYLKDFYKDKKDDSKEKELITTFKYSALDGKDGYLEIGFGKFEPMITNIIEDTEQSKDLPKTSILAYNPDMIPEKYELNQNYPNPFNPVTHIQFGIPEDSQVDVSVYNTQGKKVASLINGYKQAGTYEVVFDASGLSSGLYFYRLLAGTYSHVKRMLYVK